MDENMPGSCLDIGIEEKLSFESNIEIYPNPVTDAINLNVELGEKENLDIVVLDALGRQVIVQGSLLYPSGNHQLSISAESLTPGIYFIQIRSETNIAVKKIVVSKN